MKRMLVIVALALMVAPCMAQEKPTADGLYLSTLAEKPPCRGFKIRTTQGEFSDALCEYTDAAWSKLTLAQKQALMRARARNFVATVIENSSKPPVVPTKEQLNDAAKTQADSIASQVTALVAAKPTAEEVSELKAKLQAAIDELAKVSADVKPVEPVEEEKP